MRFFSNRYDDYDDEDSGVYTDWLGRRRYRYSMKERIFIASVFAVIYLIVKLGFKSIYIFIVFTLLYLAYLWIRAIINQNSYQKSINFVQKEFIYNSNTIKNQNCIVKFVPNESISVTDNNSTRQMRDIRTFTISRDQIKNINKCWTDICKIFCAQTYFDTIYSYFERDCKTRIEVALIPVSQPKVLKSPHNRIVNTSSVANVKDMDKVKPDLSNIKKDEKPVKQHEIQKERTLDIDVLPKSKDVYDMEDLVKKSASSNSHIQIESQETVIKLNVNTATADEISSLPGINIISAKKVVDFRNKERDFTSVDDFIQIAGVKEHFVSQIKELITVEQLQEKNNTTQNSGERIIDL